jgi:hypothetical protein
MKDCFRVLKPGGIIRIVAPDLETICKNYLKMLEIAKLGVINGDLNYEWMMLELYDQTVREKSGGLMKEYLLQNPLQNEQFVLTRIGEEGKLIINKSRTKPSEFPLVENIINLKMMFRMIKRTLKKIQKALVYFIAGKQGGRALEIGEFRLSGEVHQWMYDAHSMKKLLLETGFFNPVQKSADDSLIPGFKQFHLDTLKDGTVRKPDSFFMEAVKPEQ